MAPRLAEKQQTINTAVANCVQIKRKNGTLNKTDIRGKLRRLLGQVNLGAHLLVIRSARKLVLSTGETLL
jgi:hypothetical protein